MVASGAATEEADSVVEAVALALADGEESNVVVGAVEV